VLAEVEAAQARIAELEAMFDAVKLEEDAEEEDVDLSTYEFDDEQTVLPKAVVDALKARKKEVAAELKSVKQKDDPSYHAELKGEAEHLNELLAKHAAKEAELKTAKQTVKNVEKRRDELVDAARAKISAEEAEQLILNRWMRTLATSYESRLRAYRDALLQRIEGLWLKYAVTLDDLSVQRLEKADLVSKLLREFGYE